jgi:hypothetical protein
MYTTYQRKVEEAASATANTSAGVGVVKVVIPVCHRHHLNDTSCTTLNKYGKLVDRFFICVSGLERGVEGRGREREGGREKRYLKASDERLHKIIKVKPAKKSQVSLL